MIYNDMFIKILINKCVLHFYTLCKRDYPQLELIQFLKLPTLA